MLGICKGLIADAVVNETEAIALKMWMRVNSDVAITFPFNRLAERLDAMFRDGVVNIDERIELEEILTEIVGEDEERTTALDRPTAAGFDDPLPLLEFQNWHYVLTGRFAYGTRKYCEQEITNRGGFVESSVSGRTRVVVVGTFASPAWVQSGYGLKILSAIDHNDRGARRLHIVPEQHWLQHLA
jgi:NAD-dependent DNA ligase